ncbi:MAG TPA: c-type cytochrome [Gemmatimonadaceae bacterium]|nr:c-type cytochrome [Gemmatimonadaceae bacterium]
MRYFRAAVLIVATGCGSSSARTTPAAPLPVSAPNAASQAPANAVPAVAKDSVTLERDRYVAEIRQQITGKETLPASQVFKNIKMLNDVPAGRLLAIMNVGYGKSLGVSCTHCHVAGEWDKEDKTQKQTARDMSAMAGRINNELLKNIPNLRGPNAIVNCTTCHRGQVKPALNIP